MSTARFHAVACAVGTTATLDGNGDTDIFAPACEPDPGGWPIADADDKSLIDLAFNAVDELENKVCRLAYGFADYEPLPDAEVGYRLGMGRVKTLRVRRAALEKMRSAVGA